MANSTDMFISLIQGFNPQPSYRPQAMNFDNFNPTAVGQALLGTVNKGVKDYNTNELLGQYMANADEGTLMQLAQTDPQVAGFLLEKRKLDAQLAPKPISAVDQSLIDYRKAKIANPNAGNTPAALQLTEAYQAAVVEGDYEKANLIASFAKTMDKGVQINQQGGVEVIPNYGRALEELENRKESGKQSAMSDYVPFREREKTKQVAEETRMQDKITTFPKAMAALENYQLKNDNYLATVQDAFDKVNTFSVGTPRVLISKLPSEQRAAFDGIVETIESSNFLNELQNLKNESPSGSSGLGPVTDKDAEMIKSSVASLRRDQTPEQFMKNLLKLYDYAQGSRAIIEKTFNAEYGDLLKKRQAEGEAQPQTQEAQPNAIKFLGFE